MTAATPKAQPIKTGTQFRSVIADCNALWEVLGSAGRGVYRARVVNEPYEIDGRTFDGEYAGREDVFTADHIRRSVRVKQVFADLANDSAAWWDARTVGETLHYHNAFGCWLRGVVIIDEDGQKSYRPTAMVGEWRTWDLPRRNATGGIDRGHYADLIAKGEAWRPPASTMFESGKVASKQGDPTQVDALDLSVPEPTADEAADHDRERILVAVREATSLNLPSAERMAAIRRLVS